MIEFKTGDILAEDVEALVNTVNCVGVMGRGVALQFKRIFPDNFRAYADACRREQVKPGRPFVYETGYMTGPRFIINFPTKRHWRGKSRIEDIDAGLVALGDIIRQSRISSIAIPPLGSGLGGLDWNLVRHRIEAALGDISGVRIAVFEPHQRQSDQPARARRNQQVPTMTPGRAALVALIERYLEGLLDPFVTLAEVHKLMYFLQEAGEPLRLTYKKGAYGPYAENLRHVLNTVEGYFVVGFSDGGESPTKQLNLVPGALEDARVALEEAQSTLTNLERVSELVSGFESPFGLELLSTVHWIAAHESVQNLDEVVAATYAWNERKSQFTRRQIELAADVLAKKEWIPGVPSPAPIQ